MAVKYFNALVERAISLHKKGNYKLAQEHYCAALKLQPQHSQLLRLYGVTFYQQAKLEKAMALYYQSIAAQPTNADTWRHLGIALRDKGKYQDALEAYQKAITYKRANPEAFRNLGNVLIDLERPDEAIAAYQEALRLKPNYADAYTNLGFALEKQDKIDEAIEAHQQAIVILPTWAPAHNNLGHTLLKKGQFNLSIKALRCALKYKPEYAIAWSNLGIAQAALGKIKKAEEALKKACLLDKKNSLCKRNLAIFLQQIGQNDKALVIYEELVLLSPGTIDPYFNIAELYNARGEYALALDTLKKGVLENPEDHNAHIALSLNLLKHGHYQEGFAEYEQRLKNKHRSYEHAKEWQGEELLGKTILLYPEQGLGDMIQFIRFAELLYRKGAKILIETYACLKNFLAYSFPHFSIFTSDLTSSQQFDYFTPLMSIPTKLKLSIEDISPKPYLLAVPEKVQHWQSFLNKNTVNIGIVWQGNPQGAIDRGRSIPLDFFKVLSDLPYVQLYSLQKNYGLDQLEQAKGKINIKQMPENFDASEDAFFDTLAFMQKLDLVITSDTSVAHVGGAGGIPTWVALKHNPDWRWGMDGSKSAWYESMRLFRQTQAGDWSEVFQAMAKEIAISVNKKDKKACPYKGFKKV